MRKMQSKLFISLLLPLAVLIMISFTASCGDDDDDCLSWGENCTQEYLQNNYGTTDIHCCEGQCADHGGYLTCGS